jgi:hypothetical protein
MMHSIASRSSNNARVDSRTVEWLRLYWFCHVIGTHASTIASRSALSKGDTPFFCCRYSLGAVLQHREVSDVVI